jgi:prepilin-type N-terminal cleavage/methylation domain-containing protein
MGKRVSPGATRGMSLIEVMLAISVLAFSFSVVYGSLITMYVLGRTNEDRVRAVTAATGLLEEVQAMDVNALATYTAPEYLSLPGEEHWITADVMVPSDEDEEEMTAVPLPLEDMKLAELPNPMEVRLTINWVDKDGRGYQYSVSTKRSR